MPNKIQQLKRFGQDPDTATYEALIDLKDSVEQATDALLTGLGGMNSIDFDLIKGEKGDKGEDGVAPDLNELAQMAASLIPVPKDGRDGVSPSIQDISEEVLSQITLPKDGKDGKAGKDGRDGKDGSADTPEDIRNKLESLRDDNRLQMGAVDGLLPKLTEIEEFQEKLQNDSKFRVRIFGGGASSSGGSGAVDSFNGRTGAVTPQAGDYTAAQVTNAISDTYTSVVTDLGTQSTTVTLDGAISPNYMVTLDGNVTLALTNVATSPFRKYSILVKQDAIGSRTITMPAGTKTAGGTPITLSTAANAEDIISIFTPDNGTTIYAEIGTSFS